MDIGLVVILAIVAVVVLLLIPEREVEKCPHCGFKIKEDIKAGCNIFYWRRYNESRRFSGSTEVCPRCRKALRDK